ncbi:hypothetical protein DFH06DRAFT_1200461 [Mycena polygramma]|nr:hypothetical protein DFH06DRAFT_1200461 [Mycena polygramma]
MNCLGKGMTITSYFRSRAGSSNDAPGLPSSRPQQPMYLSIRYGPRSRATTSTACKLCTTTPMTTLRDSTEGGLSQGRSRTRSKRTYARGLPSARRTTRRTPVKLSKTGSTKHGNYTLLRPRPRPRRCASTRSSGAQATPPTGSRPQATPPPPSPRPSPPSPPRRRRAPCAARARARASNRTQTRTRIAPRRPCRAPRPSRSSPSVRP